MVKEKKTWQAISLIIIVLIVLFVIGVVISSSFLGTQRVPAGVPTGEGYPAPGAVMPMAGPTYHVFNYFNSAALMVLIGAGVVVAVSMANALYNKTDSFRASVLYIIGTLFLFASITILLFGIHDILTFTGPGETYTQPTIMQQYGWLIESFVFGVIGIAFVLAGEKIRKWEEEEHSLTYLAVTPVASMLAIFTILVFTAGLHNLILSSSSGQSFAWIIETIVFGGLTALAFKWIDKKRKENGEPGSWKVYPLYGLGYALLVPVALLFIVTVHAYMVSTSPPDIWKYFIDVIVFAVLGLLSFYAANKLKEKEEPGSSFPYILTPVGVIFALAAVWILITGFSSFLRTELVAANYRQAFSWIVEVVLFGIISYASLVYNDKLAKKGSDFEGLFPQVMAICGVVLWITALVSFFLTVQTFLFESPPELNFLAELIVYGLVSLGLIFYSDRLGKKRKILKEKNLPKALLLSGILLLIVALPLFVADLHAFLYSRSPDAVPIARDLIYGGMGGLHLLISHHLNPFQFEKKKDKKEGKTTPRPKEEKMEKKED